MSRKLVLPGGSGFLGTALAQAFSRDGWEVVILSRKATAPNGSVRTVTWDGRTQGKWAGELDGADAVINLVGRSIACVHTPEHLREILDSRVDSVQAIETAAGRCRRAPAVLVQISAIGIYGNSGDLACDEATPAAQDAIAEIVEKWEAAFLGGAAAGGPRRVVLRNGIVLGTSGGGFVPLVRLTRLFLGGAAGNGRQYLSWLHIEDFCSICRWVVSETKTHGVYNATAPTPATNAEFMSELRKALGRPWSPPAPATVIRLVGRFVMRVDPSLILDGCRCVPRRLLAEGFEFGHADLPQALRSLLAPA